MPASMTTWRPPRSRTCRTRATSQPDRATSARPGSMARRAGRRPSGTLPKRSGSSRANRSGAGTGSSSGRTGKPPPTSSVSNVSRLPRRRPTTASPRRTASRHASTARSCEPTWRWTPRGRIAPSACVASHSTRPVASVSVMPNLDAPSPTASPAIVSGVTSGLSLTSTSSGGRPRRPRPARRAIAVSTSPSSADSRATHSSGFAPAPVERIAARRSASVLPTPSREIRSSGTPARRATAHSPRDTTLAPNPREVTSATISGTSLALTEYCRIHGSGNADRTADAARSSSARSVT